MTDANVLAEHRVWAATTDAARLHNSALGSLNEAEMRHATFIATKFKNRGFGFIVAPVAYMALGNFVKSRQK